jgi:chorismate lyase/3-hydroxybenzoate synthase
MTTTLATTSLLLGESGPTPPVWLDPIAFESSSHEIHVGDLRIQIESREPLSLMRVCVPDAGLLEGDDYHDAVRACYLGVCHVMQQENSHAIRFWNYVPGISRTHSNGLSGYEIFNGGRFEAFKQLYGELASEKLSVSTAVGAADEDFTLHVLSSSQPAQPVANPRQIAPHRYSERYGPLPPVFARACGLSPAQRNLLKRSALVSGTASIVGEETRHTGDLARQLDEIRLNLASLSDALADKQAPTEQEALACYSDLRVYIPDEKDDAGVCSWLRDIFPQVSRPELVRTDLCRRDLQVEIEGTLTFIA